MIERKIRERLETLSPVSVEDWMVTIVAGDANVKVDLANYFKWITEYSFRGCVVTEEHLLDVNGRSPNLILRFQVSKGDSPDIEFTILPDLGGLG